MIRDIQKRDSGIPGIKLVFFFKYKKGSLINIKNLESEKIGQKYLHMLLFVFYCQILALQILTPPPLRALSFCRCWPGARFQPGGFRGRICHRGIASIMVRRCIA